ncbi:MAG: histidine phosphatase family protein [Rhodoluna sp.]|nr:histidine phosphatase family protein [Rhodoluna sp.]
MTKTTIGLLRHGQTNWNIDFRLQGITDIPLNETGIEQARVAGQVLAESGAAGQTWDLILSSPLSRARDTAVMVGEAIGIPGVSIEELLLERSFGEAEGLTHEEWKAKYDDTNHVPGGETLEQLEARAWVLLQRLLDHHEGKRVLTVSHGALIRTLLRLVSEGEYPREGERLGNACLSIFEHTLETGWKIASYRPQTLGH